jgi:hypothetical protein
VTASDEQTPESTAPSTGEPAEDHRLARLVFEACVVATWADGSMAAAERDHVSHLIDTVSSDEAERNELRRLALHNVNKHGLFGEIDGLAEPQKRHLFDRVVRLLTVDRRVRRKEIRFFRELRRHCGISFWRFQTLLWRLTKKRRLVLSAAFLLVAFAALLIVVQSGEEGVPPVELAELQEILLAPPAPPGIELGTEELYQLVRFSVVTVNVEVDGHPLGNGSGSVIGVDPLGQLYVLTNRHVVFHRVAEGSTLAFEAELESGAMLPAALDFYSRETDLALLVVPGFGGWARPLPLVPSRELRVGQAVYAIGSPLGLDHTFTSGVISALRDNQIQTDATVHSGSSGGPLLDAAGAICGVITTTHQHKDMSFALMADTVLVMLEERRRLKLESAAR